MSERPKELTLAEQARPNYECRACGYVYDPNKGDGKNDIPAGTPFEELPINWKCPVCGVPRSQFTNIGASNAPSGFQDNLQYGLGVNNLTPNQKSILIYGGLILTFLFFLSLYTLN
jgi:rubredoxin